MDAGDAITCTFLLEVNNQGGKTKALYSESFED